MSAQAGEAAELPLRGVKKKVDGDNPKAASLADVDAPEPVKNWAAKKFDDPEKAKAFSEWFGNSKAVDGNGEPMVVYHGSADNITEFDLDHPNRKDTGWLGTGVYLTSSSEIANSYSSLKAGRAGPNVMPLYAKVDNPYHATLADKQRIQLISHSKGAEAGRAAADKWTQELQAKGHDGVILEFKESLVGKANASNEFVVFNPSGVKSATGNKGTFNPKSNKITEGETQKP